VNEPDSQGAVTDSAGHTLDGTTADVTRDEDAAPSGLQE
jgi:hypothetical protein